MNAQHPTRRLGLRPGAIVRLAVTALAAAMITDSAVGADRPRAKLSVEVVHLGDQGCQPARIVRSQGKFVLVILNDTRQQELEIDLVEDSTKSVKAGQQIGRTNRDWTQVLNLSPGLYRFIKGGKAQDGCTLEIK